MKNEVKKKISNSRQGITPPSDEEIARTTARWLFGRNADKMLSYAPWSFVLMKLLWKGGEEPWED